MELRSQIQQIALQWPSYGHRRVRAELYRQGVHVNGKRVLRLMRADNLLCIRKKRFIRTTRSDHSLPVYPNLTSGIQLTGLDQLWVADITYIRLFAEFIFLAVILDAFSRRCIGWCLSRYINTILTLTALRMALNKRHFSTALIHHSDQGVQYATNEYVELLRANQIRISMSRRANPYDNALAESFMKTLKYEEIHLFEYQNLNEAYRRISYFLEADPEKRRLFHVMPYDPTWANSVSERVEKCCKKIGVKYVRGDQVLEPNVIYSIWQEINKASHVLVDLTGFSPSVTFELGIAHTIGRSTQIVGQNPTVAQLFPTIARIRFITYDNAISSDLTNIVQRFVTE